MHSVISSIYICVLTQWDLLSSVQNAYFPKHSHPTEWELNEPVTYMSLSTEELCLFVLQYNLNWAVITVCDRIAIYATPNSASQQNFSSELCCRSCQHMYVKSTDIPPKTAGTDMFHTSTRFSRTLIWRSMVIQCCPRRFLLAWSWAILRLSLVLRCSCSNAESGTLSSESRYTRRPEGCGGTETVWVG